VKSAARFEDIGERDQNRSRRVEDPREGDDQQGGEDGSDGGGGKKGEDAVPIVIQVERPAASWPMIAT
jgi:hypothetical protein